MKPVKPFYQVQMGTQENDNTTASNYADTSLSVPACIDAVPMINLPDHD